MLPAGLACLALALVAAPEPARAESRVALVIGNSNYGGELGVLKNPVNDAKLVAQSLRNVGFTVIEAEDADLQAMRRAISEFGQQLSAAGEGATGLFFFAGHGVQLANTTEMDSNETIKHAVMAGMGISFITEHAIGLELSAGRIVRLPVTGTPVMRNWYVVHRSDKQLLPMTTAFLDFMRSEGPRLTAEPAPYGLPASGESPTLRRNVAEQGADGGEFRRA